MAQLETIRTLDYTIVVDLEPARRAVKKIRVLADEANRELAIAEEQLLKLNPQVQALKAELTELGIKLELEEA